MFNSNEIVARLIEHHGKELLKDVVDLLLITKNPSSDQCYNLLVKHGIITTRTKQVYHSVSNNRYSLSFKVYRTSGKEIINIYIRQEDMASLLEELKPTH